MAKKYLFFIALLAVIISNNSFSKIAIVDGVGGVTDRFAKISDAVAATSYDTIRVLNGIYAEASTITIDRKVIMIGNGYRNVPNGGTHVSANFSFTSNSAGSRFLGFRVINGSTVSVSADGITVANNMFVGGGYVSVAATNDTVRNNIFGIGGQYSYGLYLQGAQSVVIANNVFRNLSYAIYSYQSYTNAVLAINNFLDACSYLYYQYQGYCQGLTATGNILYKGSYVGYNGNSQPAALYAGNLHWNMISGYKTTHYPGNPNDNSEGDPSFKNFSTSSGFVYNDDPSNDSDLRLTDGSSAAVDIGYPAQAPMTTSYIDYHPLYTFGGARSDAGIYGGPWTFPFPHGAPILPAVTSISVSPSVVSPGGTLNLNVSGSVGGFTGRNN